MGRPLLKPGDEVTLGTQCTVHRVEKWEGEWWVCVMVHPCGEQVWVLPQQLNAT